MAVGIDDLPDSVLQLIAEYDTWFHHGCALPRPLRSALAPASLPARYHAATQLANCRRAAAQPARTCCTQILSLAPACLH